MPIPIKTNPLPLGKLVPGAPFATACISVLANYTGTGILVSTACDQVGLQAASGNVGNIYVCSSAAAPDTVNFTNIIAILSAGGTFANTATIALNDVELSNIFIGAGNATDYCFGYLRFH